MFIVKINIHDRITFVNNFLMINVKNGFNNVDEWWTTWMSGGKYIS